MNSALLIVCFLFLSGPLFIDNISLPHDHWQLLGNFIPSNTFTKSEIETQSDIGIFKGLQFRTKGSECYLEKCEVIFLDGTSLQFLIQEKISKNNRSKILELNSNFKKIEKLNVWYILPLQMTNASSIELYGKH